MYVVVQHQVTDPDAFWSVVRQAGPNLPEGFNIHHCLPTEDGTRAVCVWEGASEDSVRNFVESAVGSASRNEYFPVTAKEGVNLPPGVTGS